MNKKIYLDCTHTYNSGLNTGIQRVVKNIVKNSKDVSKDLGVEIIPIILINKCYYTFDNFLNLKDKNNNIKLKNYLKKFYKLFKKFLSFILLDKFSQILNSPNITIFLNEITDKILFSADKNVNKKIEFTKDDILILLDSVWYNNHKTLLYLKTKEVKIINIIYDFIPLIYPQFCDEHLTKAFGLWYKKSINLIDKYIAISYSVENESYEYIKKNLDPRIPRNKFDFFYLGANINDNKYNEDNINNSFKQIFKTKNVYITVSTIEPRKNHEYILNAFEELWNKNINIKYVIIGKIGWKVESLIERIQNHKELNKRLFLLNDVSDEELLFSYKNSNALIFASYTEGFGLPIIESLYNQLQVIVSDTPIHREIGQEYVSYFNLKDVHSLVNLIEKNSFIKDINNFKWIDWKESTKQLITKVLYVK
jgi:alpha-1,2-rhamnosyltransferase